ncbi:MAG: hypothetical protein IJD22_06045 [Clostridia bacterium]|nr:hypothetical protein [Clostridia bacterium]
MENFERYFLHDKKVFLENISYETVKAEGRPTRVELVSKDTIVAQLMKNGVKICFNRAMSFDPEAVFSLSVTYSMVLLFDPSTKDEIDWRSTDIAGEFRRSCPHLLSLLMARTALMIGQITSSSGQPPIMTPAAAPKA